MQQKEKSRQEAMRPAGGIRFLRQHLIFLLLGIGSTIWFLIRVIPKPSRAGYPCMRAAAPIASGFVIYLLGLVASVTAFRTARLHLHRARYGLALLCGSAALFFLLFTLASDDTPSQAEELYESSLPVQADLTDQTPNQPVGTARGIFPGRVVWVHDPTATNENAKPALFGAAWFLSKNNSQFVIDRMFSTALTSLTGESGDREAWEAVFKFYNRKRGMGEKGYTAGEKILIKTNATSSWGGNYSTSDLSAMFNSYYGISETSPHLVLTVLRHLVKTVGVAQKDIYVGDPMKHIYKHCFELWYAEFPQVNYLDHDYGAEKNRLRVVPAATASLIYSDRGNVISAKSDRIYTIYDEVQYMINIPTLKGHKHAGVTMFAKNHFGSHTRSDASHLHKGLVATEQGGVVNRAGYGLYRVQVDLMGHKVLGGKNLFYLMDALWSSDSEIGPPVKFRMTPFNDDWTSSLFLSLDPVAIESVGYDFLHAEMGPNSGHTYSFPRMSGVDDYLHQAASSSNWPAGISYDPENDGTPIASLGVHEHWNNSIDKQYSRNLGTGEGIELVRIAGGTGVELAWDGEHAPAGYALLPSYPNPFNDAATLIFQLAVQGEVELTIHDISGRRVRSLIRGEKEAGVYRIQWDGRNEEGGSMPSGTYLSRLQVRQQGNVYSASRRMALVR